MADQEQEHKINYTVGVNLNEADLQVTSGLQRMAGNAQATLGNIFGYLKGGMMEPMTGLMGLDRSGMGAGRQMISQDMAAGFANLKTAASEYTEGGFYRQMLFGTAPEFGASGLRYRMQVQQQAAALPFLPGNQMTTDQMISMGNQAQAPFTGLLGFERRASDTLLAAQQAGLGNYVNSPHQMLQADLQLNALTAGFNKIYRVAPQEAGQLYTTTLALGTAPDQAQQVYQQIVRNQAAGVPMQQSLTATASANQMAVTRATFGMGGQPPTADIISQQMLGPLAGQALYNRNQPYLPEELSAFSARVSQQYMLLGANDKALSQAVQNSLYMQFGMRAKNIDGDMLIAEMGTNRMRQSEEENRSASIASSIDKWRSLTSPKALVRDALTFGGDMLFHPKDDMFNRLVGYSDLKTLYSPQVGGSIVSKGTLDLASRYGSGMRLSADSARAAATRTAARTAYGTGDEPSNPQGVVGAYMSYAQENPDRMKAFEEDARKAAGMLSGESGSRMKAFLANGGALIDKATGGVASAALSGPLAGGVYADFAKNLQGIEGGSSSQLFKGVPMADDPRTREVQALYNSNFRAMGLPDPTTRGQAATEQNILLQIGRFNRGEVSADAVSGYIKGAGLGDKTETAVLGRWGRYASSYTEAKTGAKGGAFTLPGAEASGIFKAVQGAEQIDKVMQLSNPDTMRLATDTMFRAVSEKGGDRDLDFARGTLKKVNEHAAKGALDSEDYQSVFGLRGKNAKFDRIFEESFRSQAGSAPTGSSNVDMSLAGASIKASEALSIFGKMIEKMQGPTQGGSPKTN